MVRFERLMPDELWELFLAPRLPILHERGGIPHTGLVRKSWYLAIDRLGMPRYKPHDLRHKWATVALSQGASLHETARWMGHHAISITAATYGHLTQDGRERCQQIMDGAYGPYVTTAVRAEERAC